MNLMCLDEKIAINGSYETDRGSTLMVVFEKCDKEKRKCKDNKVIDEWLKLRYIVVL